MVEVGTLFGVRQPSARLEPLILICIPSVVTSLVLYGLYYYLQGAWQLLAMAGGGLLALAGLGLCLLLKRRHPLAAAWALLFSLLIVLGVVPLFVEGLTWHIIVCATLLIVGVGASVLPDRWHAWLAIVAAFGGYAWLIDQTAPLPRYAPIPAIHPALYLLGVSTTFLVPILGYGVLTALRVHMSIRARLFIGALLLVLFAGGAIGYFSTIVLIHQEHEETIDQLSAVAARAESRIEAWTNSMQLPLDSFARDARPQLTAALQQSAEQRPSRGAAVQRLRAHLIEVADRMHLFDQLYVADATGQVLVSTAGSPPPIDTACLRQARDGLCFQPPRYSAGLGRVVVVVAEPIVDQRGDAIGIVAGYAGLAALDAIVAAPIGVGDSGVAYLVATDRSILAPPQLAGAAGPPPAAGPRGAEQALATRSNGSGLYDNYRGVPVVGVYRWLPKLQVALLAEQDQAEAFHESVMAIAVDVGVTLIVLATAAAMTLLIVHDMVAPLRRLAAAVERSADEALDLTTDVQQNDEIGALARAFNAMTARLRAARDQLEQRVGQRTEQLALANAELQCERNKLESILDSMEDGVYIVSQQHAIQYANPTLERAYGSPDGRMCYEWLYDRTEICPWCPNEQVCRGVSVRRETPGKDGKTYEIFDAPLCSTDGTRTKLAIFHDITARKQTEEQLIQRNHELAILSRRLVEIQESERHYIARELHDEAGQALTALMLRLGMLERDLERGVAIADRVAEFKHTLEEVLENLHGLAMNLRPSSLDHVGLAPALRQYAERMSARHGLSIDFSAIGLDGRRLPPEMEITIYRVVQEALANIVRHANATHADIIVERRPGQVRVIVEDNGCGFDTAAAMYSGRLGLLGMRERAEMLGGRLTIDSAPEAGATILMEVPYDDAHPDRG